MKTPLLILCVLYALTGAAQQAAPRQKPVFYSANQVGLLEGASGSAFLVQTVNGLSYKRWAAGLGVGIDKYKERSIPIFIQFKRNLFNKVPLSIYADGGMNMLWPLPEEVQAQRWQKRNNKSGLYLDGGLQYHWTVAKEGAIIFSAGYSEKRYSWQTNNPSFCIDGSCPETVNKWYYTYRRIAIKAGWRF